MAQLVTTAPLIKEQLADKLKDAIVEGRLTSGQRVVEAVWAREFGVAQASVREAINLLIGQGFLMKDVGCSARIPRYSAEDVRRIYQIRGALEGLAAQLAAERHADLAPLQAALDRMQSATVRNDVKELIDSDLAFHLALAEASANPFLVQMLTNLLRPLFTFILVRMLETHETTVSWTPDLPRHRQMIYLIRDSDPAIAGEFVQYSVGRFVSSAQAVWWPEKRVKRAGGSVTPETNARP